MKVVPIVRRVRASAFIGWLARRKAVGPLPEEALPGALEAPSRSLANRRQRLTGLLATVEGRRRVAWGLVIVFVVADILVVGQHVLVRHFSYHSEAFDLGNMDQAVWNTLHGHLFRFTNRGGDWYGPPTRLGIHVEPILLLIAPLYLLHSDAATLLALQTVALALGTLPIMALSLRRLPDLPLLGVGFAAAYLLAPELLGEALWDFHPVALATPLLLAALYALDVRRYRWFLVAGVLAAACKEDVALALAPLGLLIAVPIAWTAFCFLVIIPHFNGGVSAGGNALWYRYASLGATPAAAARRIATDPGLLLSVVVTPDKLSYLGLLLRTGGGLGIFAPFWWLVGLCELAINLLSAQQAQYSGFYQYNAMLLPALFAGAIYGTAALRAARLAALSGAPSPPLTASPRSLAGYVQRLGRWQARLIGRVPVSPRLIVPIMLVWLLVATGWNLVTIRNTLGVYWASGAGPAPHQAQIDALLRRIPPDAVVAATDTLDPHLTDRTTTYFMPDPLAYRAEYVAIDFMQIDRAWRADDIQMFATMVGSGRYHVLGVIGSVTVLQRVGPLQPASGAHTARAPG